MPTELLKEIKGLFKDIKPKDEKGKMAAVEKGLTLLIEEFEKEVAKTKAAKEALDEKVAMLD